MSFDPRGVLYNGQTIYRKTVDFGAGPNNTTKSVVVAGTFRYKDIGEIVSVRAVAKNANIEGYNTDNTADVVVFNKMDKKVYFTSTEDRSGEDFDVVIEYTRVDDSFASNPTCMVVTSGGGWGDLPEGLSVVEATSYNGFSVSAEQWSWNYDFNNYIKIGIYTKTTFTFTTHGSTTVHHWYKYIKVGLPGTVNTIHSTTNFTTARSTTGTTFFQPYSKYDTNAPTSLRRLSDNIFGKKFTTTARTVIVTRGPNYQTYGGGTFTNTL